VQDDRIKAPEPCERFIDPRTQPFVDGRSRGDLPHLHKSGGTYFVTFCLNDVAHRKALERRFRDGERAPDDVARYSEPGPSEGSCVLGVAENARIVESAMSFFQGVRYALHAWVVMPNHAHVVVTPSEGHGLSEILHSWKSFSANRINAYLGRSGRLWQEESFDHVIRSEEDLVKFIDYTENNPVAARLCDSPENWPYSSARFR